MAILGEALTIVVFHVKVDPHPAADLGPVPVFCGPAHRCRTGGGHVLRNVALLRGITGCVPEQTRTRQSQRQNKHHHHHCLAAGVLHVRVLGQHRSGQHGLRAARGASAEREKVRDALEKSCAFDCDTELKSDFTVIVHVAMESWAARRSMLFPS